MYTAYTGSEKKLIYACVLTVQIINIPKINYSLVLKYQTHHMSML